MKRELGGGDNDGDDSWLLEAAVEEEDKLPDPKDEIAEVKEEGEGEDGGGAEDLKRGDLGGVFRLW